MNKYNIKPLYFISFNGYHTTMLLELDVITCRVSVLDDITLTFQDISGSLLRPITYYIGAKGTLEEIPVRDREEAIKYYGLLQL